MNIAQVEIPDTMIDLGLGQPDLSLLPIDQLRIAADQRIIKENALWLQYGAELGAGEFRNGLADFLTKSYGHTVSADELMVTNGISHGLEFLCSRFAGPNDVIFVEEPTYLFALQLFADRGLKVVSIPMDKDGLIIDELEKALVINQPVFLYTVPTFHNPSGITLTESRRIRLVELSEEYNFRIFADEVYHLLAFSSPPLPMPAFDPSDQIFSLGSFSKILAPGLRLGWIHAKSEMLENFIDTGILQSGGGFNPFTSSIVHHVIKTGALDTHIRKLRSNYAGRAAALSAALHRYLPDVGTFVEPVGGFFIWLQLPDKIDARRLRKIALSYNTNFQPGYRFSKQGGLKNYARFCFAYYPGKALEEGIKRLADAIHSYLE